mmetsp:Transcript_31030/g.61420  ORF Transcript_31030/g.61420 Transcript_31030/m.61420 type:complete len:219 (-) Transcript_31030:174-830(-)
MRRLHGGFHQNRHGPLHGRNSTPRRRALPEHLAESAVHLVLHLRQLRRRLRLFSHRRRRPLPHRREPAPLPRIGRNIKTGRGRGLPPADLPRAALPGTGQQEPHVQLGRVRLHHEQGRPEGAGGRPDAQGGRVRAAPAHVRRGRHGGALLPPHGPGALRHVGLRPGGTVHALHAGGALSVHAAQGDLDADRLVPRVHAAQAGAGAGPLRQAQRGVPLY